MENVRELDTESTRAILSGLAIQQRERETSLQRLSRLRKEASAEIDRLIAFLDASDPYVTTELEEQVDDGAIDDTELEPSLGWSEGAQGARFAESAPDLEDEHDGAEPDEADYEPSIGFDPCTIIAEDDEADREPSLGWTVDGCTGGTTEPDLEEGSPARPPQGRTDLEEATVWASRTHQRCLNGLTTAQRQRLQDRRRHHPHGGVGFY